LKIVSNAIPLLSPRTGIGQYTYKLFKTLLRLDEANKYYFFYGKSFSRAIENNHNPSLVAIKEPIRKAKFADYLSWKMLDYYFWTKGLMENFDIYHETNYIPFKFKGKIATTVRSLVFVIPRDSSQSEVETL
jgi:alpha-1,3-rhamnosyl/mannosyltransferase